MTGMVLLDTTVWAEHLVRRDLAIAHLVERDALLHHPFVAAEIALIAGSRGGPVCDALAYLRTLTVLPDDTMLAFAAAHALAGGGLGFVGTHLLASTAHAGARLWSRDPALAAQAERLGLGYQPD